MAYSEAYSMSNLQKKTENLSIEGKSDINILLLGKTGTGKSTFINSIANYLTYENFEEAENEKLLSPIPTMFNMRDRNGSDHMIYTGDGDKNEFLSVGDSATQDVKTYVFPIWNGKANLRLIDTPGMGDTRGIRQDDINSENILSYVGQLEELHAICFLFHPNDSKGTVFFKYCMAQILSRLDKSASSNIIFAFTNTRGSDYGPGDAISLLKKEIDYIKSKPPHADIPINKNVFCFDNEAFRFLAATKYGLKLKRPVRQRNIESWENSVEECWNMIDYITGFNENRPLKPHRVQNTSAINEARRMIIQLTQPLAEISQNISHNVEVLKRHEANLEMDHDSLKEFQDKLYIPTVNLTVRKLNEPVTVCTTSGCAEVHQKAGRNIWHYKQRCHDPCYLKNVTREIIGDAQLINCAAMARTNECQECGCNYKLHQHIYFETSVEYVEEIDPFVEKNINDKEKMVKNVKRLIESMRKKIEELDNEHHVIITICARFANFLQNNAITPFSDSYKEYIEYIIKREQSMGELCDKETVTYLKKLLNEYEEAKKAFDAALNLGRTDRTITPQDISDSIKTLYTLEHNGKKIKELYECQTKPRVNEHRNTEYVHKLTNRKSNLALAATYARNKIGIGSVGGKPKSTRITKRMRNEDTC